MLHTQRRDFDSAEPPEAENRDSKFSGVSLRAAAASPGRSRLTPRRCASRFWKPAGNPPCLPRAERERCQAEPCLPPARRHRSLLPYCWRGAPSSIPQLPARPGWPADDPAYFPKKSCAGATRARTRGTCIVFDYYLWVNAVNMSQEDLHESHWAVQVN